MNLFGILNMQAPGDFSPNGATQLSPGHRPGIRAAMRIFAREFPQGEITQQAVSQFCIDPASLQTDQVTDQASDQVKRLLAVMGPDPQRARELMDKLDLSHRSTFHKNYLNPALDAGWIERTRPESPRVTDLNLRG